MADKESEKPKKESQNAAKGAVSAQASQKKSGAGFQQSQLLSSKVARRKDKETPDFRGIIRLVGKDIDGHMNVSESLRRVKGVGHNLAQNLSKIISTKLGISVDELIGNLSEEQFTKLEDVIKFPQKYGIKVYFLNRQRDFDSGENKHLVMSDLTFTTRQDAVRERDSRSYRGWRHSIGQKVRGQHTRTTGRTGLTVGVLKKAVKAQKEAAATGAQEKGAAPAVKEAKK